MEVKIKQGKELINASIEMVDGVMVVSPKKVNFKPKDGDVLTYLNKGKPTIYVYRASELGLTSYYVSYSSLNDVVYISDKTDVLYKWMEDVRPATREEKKLLFDKLAEEGWSWDGEKKELVKLKWKPKMQETYYFPQCVCYEFVAGTYDWKEHLIDMCVYTIRVGASKPKKNVKPSAKK